MGAKPFLKWAGGKRWILDRPEFRFPTYSGRYIEPFVGGGAVFFSHAPSNAIISDANSRLIEVYIAIQTDWQSVYSQLVEYQKNHSHEFYYNERARIHGDQIQRAAQFIYLNRTCFNGLYRENLRGQFNVPIGTKTKVVFGDDDFEKISRILSSARIIHADFESTIEQATAGDCIFVDPPYTVAHNMNGFVKYNQNIFSWQDQERLKSCLLNAKARGAHIMMTNAAHQSILDLYKDFGTPIELSRPTVISGTTSNRMKTSELLYVI